MFGLVQAAGLAGPVLFKRGLDVLSESSKAQGYSKAAMYAAVSALVLSGVSKVRVLKNDSAWFQLDGASLMTIQSKGRDFEWLRLVAPKSCTGSKVK